MKHYATLSEICFPGISTGHIWDRPFTREGFLQFVHLELQARCGKHLSYDELMDRATDPKDPIFILIHMDKYE